MNNASNDTVHNNSTGLSPDKSATGLKNGETFFIGRFAFTVGDGRLDRQISAIDKALKTGRAKSVKNYKSSVVNSANSKES